MLTALHNDKGFSGRASRREFWLHILLLLLIQLGLVFAILPLDSKYAACEELVNTLATVISFALLLPTLAVAARRLHDTGRSAWFLLLTLIPFGGILLLIWFCENSSKGSNIYGENPKGEK